LSNFELGIWGEREAVKFLKKKKYKVIEQNYRCKLGEVDIIARHGAYLVFIEVKTRASNRYGLPMEAVDEAKQRKLTMLALYYQKSKGLLDLPIRFDVVQILGEEISLIEGAFYPEFC